MSPDQAQKTCQISTTYTPNQARKDAKSGHEYVLHAISNFGFEFVLTISWLNAPSMVISIVRRHPALLLGKQRFAFEGILVDP